MTSLRIIASLIVGAVFITSGYLKLMDPVGTSLIMEEYFRILHLSVFGNWAMEAGAMLSSIEFALGFSLLFRVRLRDLSYILFAFMVFMTGLTLYLALFEPIHDCGCFGQAITLTNAQTFYKNLVLLPLTIFIFVQRKNYRRLSSRAFEWSMVGFSFVVAFSIGLYSYFYQPPIDFTAFSPGKYLEDVTGKNEQVEYSTLFIYEKDGQRAEFGIDNLPDSTWTYVDAVTTRNVLSSEGEIMPLPMVTSDGTDVSDYMINSSLDAFISVIYDSRINDASLAEIKDFSVRLENSGMGRLFVLCSADAEFAGRLASEYGFEVYRSDYKSLITLNRSNGGLVYVDSGEIIKKWPLRSLPEDEELEELKSLDPKEISVKEEIWDSLYWEILAFSFIVMLIVGNAILKRYNIKHHIDVNTIEAVEDEEKLHVKEASGVHTEDGGDDSAGIGNGRK